MYKKVSFDIYPVLFLYRFSIIFWRIVSHWTHFPWCNCDVVLHSDGLKFGIMGGYFVMSLYLLHYFSIIKVYMDGLYSVGSRGERPESPRKRLLPLDQLPGKVNWSLVLLTFSPLSMTHSLWVFYFSTFVNWLVLFLQKLYN